jgi:hypothetical protein
MAYEYIAASVPRFLRQTKLAYLPPEKIIGTHYTECSQGGKLVYDVIMLSPQQFSRMKAGIGMQLAPAPTPTPLPNNGALFPGFVVSDAKRLVVPETEPDPESFARAYFLKEFGLDGASKPENEGSLDRLMAFCAGGQEVCAAKKDS